MGTGMRATLTDEGGEMVLCGPEVRTMSAVSMIPSLQHVGSVALALQSLRKAARSLANGPGRPV